MAADIVRIVLSLALVVLVYFETGWATALCIFLLVARCEAFDFIAGSTFK